LKKESKGGGQTGKLVETSGRTVGKRGFEGWKKKDVMERDGKTVKGLGE